MKKGGTVARGNEWYGNPKGENWDSPLKKGGTWV